MFHVKHISEGFYGFLWFSDFMWKAFYMFLFHLETLNYFFFLSCSKSKHIVYNEGSITLELKSARQLLILHQCRDYPVRAKHGPATLE